MSQLETRRDEQSIIGISRPSPAPEPRRYGRRRSDKIPWAGVVVLVTATLLLFFGKAAILMLFGPTVPFELQASDVGGQLHIRWNGQADDIVRAESAILEVTDGKQQYQYPVSTGVLASGTLDYTRKTDDVAATLVLFKNGHETERRIVRSISAPQSR
jgi:hypothetical protein